MTPSEQKRAFLRKLLSRLIPLAIILGGLIVLTIIAALPGKKSEAEIIPVAPVNVTVLPVTVIPIVPDEFIQIAELEGEPVAFIAGLPNINELIRRIDGKLLPTGWLKLVQGIRAGRFETGRVPLMGVRKKYQNRPVGMALAFLTIDALRREMHKRGIKEVEMSWILEDNSGMRSILDSIGSDLYKTYRLYEKDLDISTVAEAVA